MKNEIEVGAKMKCINAEILDGNDFGPSLTKDAEYTLESVVFDKAGNPHYNVGLPSKLNYVSSYETGEELKDGDKIHWCHPSRFEKI